VSEGNMIDSVALVRALVRNRKVRKREAHLLQVAERPSWGVRMLQSISKRLRGKGEAARS
jgi:hypothetical protein